MQEHPLYKRYRKVQREIIPKLASIAPETGVNTWGPAALGPILADKDISYYNLIHLGVTTLGEANAIFIVYPYPSSPGLCYYGIIVKNPKTSGHSYYSLERTTGANNARIIKWTDAGPGSENSRPIFKDTCTETTDATFIENIKRLCFFS